VRRARFPAPILLVGLALGVVAAVSAPPAAGVDPSASPSVAGDADATGAVPSADDPRAPVAGPVLAPVGSSTGGTLDRAAVKAALAPLLRGGALGPGRSPARVIDVASGAVLYNAVDEPTVPASTMKLVTAASVLDALGADATLRTRTVLENENATVPRVVLVGAGDSSLGSTRAKVGGDGTSLVPASLEQLAASTARSLASRGISRVKVGYDDSLFRGAAMHPSWSSSFPAAGIVAPVSALQVDQGRRSPGGVARVADPAARAADVFAEQLEAAGVRVRGEPKQRVAEPGATAVAHVDSPAVGVLVERMLATSDNDYAEALGRLGALGGGEPASFAGVGRRGEQVLADLGITPAGDRVADASGLSRRNRLTPQTLTDLLRATSDQTAIGFGSIRSGLAVAGATGSLRDRYTAPETQPGRGVVRAKTGTLTGVTGLAGLVSRPDGRLLAFAFVDDSTPGGAFGARAALDRAAAELVTCDCAEP